MIKFIIIHVHETFAFKAIFLLFCLYMHSEFSTILCIDIAIKMKSFFYFTQIPKVYFIHCMSVPYII